eukprot:TRINITY_DN16176_c0_g1_i2.p1 TRINITY_DN16176_c0_g1~~TRINITY_DN16176_c0_g1_i2.p1  ORF type:complete len:3105 (-),score=492.61 TRINITY_DN16176_c0_g1_i2:105-9254(-)
MAQQAIPSARTVFLDPVSDEKIQIEAMVNLVVEYPYTREGCPSQGFDALKMWLEVELERNRLAPDAHWQAVRTIMMECIAEAQRFIRSVVYKRDCSSVSLRDVSRCVRLVPWILGLFAKRRIAEEQMPAVRRPGCSKRLPKCQQLRDALLISITHCYAMRLNLRKEELREIVCQHWDRARGKGFDKDFFPTPEGEEFWAPYKDLTGFIVNQLHFEIGIARNDAIRENTFALFVGMCTGTATFIVGKPGTSKSLSLDMLAGMMLNREHPFWGQFPVVHKKVFQCDPLVTPGAILQAAEQIGRLQLKQKRHSTEEHVGVLVLEEVGVTALSPHNPLMSLHSLIDHGVEVDGQFVNICIIGISNWRVDPAKTNRANFIFRGDPTPEDLQLTGKQIILGTAAKSAGGGGTGGNFEHLSSVLSSLASILSNTIIMDARYSYYYGLRDYYGLVKFLQTEVSLHAADELGLGASAAAITLHTVRWALARNLSTLPQNPSQTESGRFQRDLEESVERALVGANRHHEQPAEWFFAQQYLCSACARAARHANRRMGGAALTCRRLDRRERLERRACECPMPVPVLWQVAWNLEDRNARYLMLITKGSQALPLLFFTGLARAEAATVIFGSEFEEDIGDTTTLRHLQRVQGSMRLGQLLILVHCRRIYENLLDMTNQHHLEEHGRRYTRLSMQAHSRYFPVHDNFRCIILVEEDELRALPPPFLNRFEKARLTYDTILDLSHRQDLARLQARLLARSAGKHLDLWAELLPGETAESLQSLAFVTAGFSDDADERAECAVFRALQAARFIPLLRMRCKDIALVDEACKDADFARVCGELYYYYFSQQKHHTMHAVLEHARRQHLGISADPSDEQVANFDKSCPWADELGLHIVLLTEQHPSLWPADALEQDLRGPNTAVKVLPLDQITSESNILGALQQFYSDQQPKGLENSYLVLLSPSSLPAALLHKTLFICSDERRKFLTERATKRRFGQGSCGSDVGKEADFETRRHVILVLSTLNSNFTIRFDENWHYVFVDCVRLPSIAGLKDVTVDHLIERSLLGSGFEEEEEKPLLAAGEGEGLVNVPRILRASLPVIVSSLKYKHEDWSGDPQGLARSSQQRAAQFYELLKREDSPPVRALVMRLLAELERDNRWADGQWLTEAIKRLDVTGSCFEALGQFLLDGVVAVFKELLTLADLNNNLRLAVDSDLEALWTELFESPFVSGSPGGRQFVQGLGQAPNARLTCIGLAAPQGEGPQAAAEHGEARITEGIDDLHFPAKYEVRFPFGSLVCQRLWKLRAQRHHLHELLIQGCPALMRLDVWPVRGVPHLELLAADVLAGAFPDATPPQLELIVLFCRLSGAFENCVCFLRFLWAQERLLVRLSLFANWVGAEGLQLAASKLQGISHAVDKDSRAWDARAEDTAESESIPAPGVLLLLQTLQVSVDLLIARALGPDEASPAELREFLGHFLVLFGMVDTQVGEVVINSQAEEAVNLRQIKGLLEDIRQWQTFLEYAVTLRTHFVSGHAVGLVCRHLKDVAYKVRGCASGLEREFLEFLCSIVVDADAEDKVAASRCFVPAIQVVRGAVCLPADDKHDECLTSARSALCLLTGQHELFQGASALHLAWQPQAGVKLNCVQLSYTAAAALASSFLRLFDQCLTRNGDLAHRIGKIFAESWNGAVGGYDGPLALLMAQVWADRLDARSVRDKLQLLTSPPALAKPTEVPVLLDEGSDSTFVLRRVLTVSSLKYLLQLAADCLLSDAASADRQTAVRLLSAMLADMTSALKQTLAGGGDVAPLPKAGTPVLAAMSMLPEASHQHLLHLFLRQLTKSGVEREAGVRALRVDAEQEAGQQIFPGLQEISLVRRFSTKSSIAANEAPSPFAFHAGYASALHAIRLAIGGDAEQALKILQGQVPAKPMPDGDRPRRLALALVLVEKALKAEDTQRAALLAFLERVPYMEQEVPIVQLVRLLLDPDSSIPESIRALLWHEDNERLAYLALHVIVFLVLDDGASPALAFLREALRGGSAALESSNIPANVGSSWLNYMRMYPPAHWVYSCPNGHMYVTDACSRINSRGKCPCGADIGGPTYGVCFNGNVRHGTIQEVMAEWDTRFSRLFADTRGFQVEERDASRSERGLSPAMFRTLRFATEAAMVGHGLLHSGGNFDGALHGARLFQQMQNEVWSLKDALFAGSADEVPACLYLHAITAALLGTPPAGLASWPLPNAESCDTVEVAMASHAVAGQSVFGEHHTHVVRRMQDAMDEVHASASRDELVEAVKRTAWFLHHNGGEGLSAAGSTHWVPSRLLSLEGFWASVDAESAQVQVLQLLRRRETSLGHMNVLGAGEASPPLSLLRHLPAVAVFLKLLYENFNMKVNRVEAETTLSLGDALTQLEEEDPVGAQQIRRALPAFAEALRETWPHVHRHPLNPCINYDDKDSPAFHLRLLHEQDCEDMALEKLLVSEEGPMQALFGTLSAWQRDIVLDPTLHTYVTTLGQKRGVSSLEARPFACSEMDVVSFSSRGDLAPQLADHVIRSLDAKNMGFIRFEYLDMLEAHVVERTRLLKKPLLRERLPAVQYLDEMTTSAVLSTLDERVGLVQQLLLPPPVVRALHALAVHEPASRELLRSYAFFLAAVAVQINEKVDQAIADFVKGCAGPLLGPTQRRANAILQRVPQLGCLRLSHLRALSATCWDGQVHAQFARDLDPAEAGALDEALAEVSKHESSLLLAALRRAGSEEYSYDRGWPETVETSDGRVSNPRFVCPGGSLKFSAIEPVLLGEWDDVPDAFERIPITCLQASLRAVERHVHGEKESAKSLGLESSTTFTSQAQFRAATVTDGAHDILAEEHAWELVSVYRDLPEDDWDIANIPPAQKDPPPKAASRMPPTTARPESQQAVSGWTSKGNPLQFSVDIDVDSMVTRQLEASLKKSGRKLVQTPRDGSCLFHALNLSDVRGPIATIDVLRRDALAKATPEQIEIAALDRGMTAEEYRSRMLQQGTWGDDLMIGLLAIAFQRSITVVSPTYRRTWGANGVEFDGDEASSTWIAYNGNNHYYGTTLF